jgi:hypothetical protein
LEAFRIAQDKIQGLPAAEQEAERLLARMSPSDAIERLVSTGVPRTMADAAVAVAARRIHSPS